MVRKSRKSRSSHFPTIPTSHFPGLGNLQRELPDPILNRTFGALVTVISLWQQPRYLKQGTNLQKINDTILTTSTPQNDIEINIYTLTNITTDIQTWLDNIHSMANNSQSFENAFSAHLKWWNQFWERSWIQILATSSE